MIIRNTKELSAIQNIMTAKTDRIKSVEKLIRQTTASIPNASPEELDQAITDINAFGEEIAELKEWIGTAKKAIRAFYSPATV